jgi:hypothetical protein
MTNPMIPLKIARPILWVALAALVISIAARFLFPSFIHDCPFFRPFRNLKEGIDACKNNGCPV